MPQCPEHDKMRAVENRSQVIGEFLEWLQSGEGRDDGKPVELAYFDRRNDILIPDNQRVETLLAKFFEIDLVKLEEEKLAMLAELRENHSRKEKSDVENSL